MRRNDKIFDVHISGAYVHIQTKDEVSVFKPTAYEGQGMMTQSRLVLYQIGQKLKTGREKL